MNNTNNKESQSIKNSIFNNLNFKLSIPFFLMLIFSIMVIFSLSYYNYIQAKEKTTTESISTLKSVSHDVNTEVGYLISRGSLISSFASNFSQAETKKLAQGFVNSKPQTLRVAFYNLDKKIEWEVFSTPGLAIKDKISIPSVPSSMYRENFFFSEKNVYLHNVDYLIIDKDSKKIGVIRITYDISYFWSIISSFDAENIYIIDKDGNILLSKTAQEPYNKKFDKSILSKYTSMYDNLVTYNNENKEVVSGVATQLKDVNWILIIEDLQSKKISKAFNLSLLAILVGLFVLLAALFEIYIYRRNILKPLNLLEKNANFVASGDYKILKTNSTNYQFDSILESINQIAFIINLLKNDFDNQLEIKTKKLSKSVKEAESMSSLMVNRELKMIDLKRENQELKEILDKQKKEIPNIDIKI